MFCAVYSVMCDIFYKKSASIFRVRPITSYNVNVETDNKIAKTNVKTAETASNAGSPKPFITDLEIGKIPTCKTGQIKDALKTALQNARAKLQNHLLEQKTVALEIKRLEAALDALGEPSSGLLKDSRCVALRNYLLNHPDEVVSTKSLCADPNKYGIITASATFQVNWLYGKNNPTARKYFSVKHGEICLREHIMRDTSPSHQSV